MNYSILMSVYYKENPEWLRYSIESMMNQTVKTDDFVIIEDGPLTDELEKIIVGYETKFPNIFHIVRLEKNGGLGLALRRGILECKNEFIARMDSDDYSVPDRIEKELNLFKEYPELGMVGSNVLEFEGDISNVVTRVVLPQTHDEIYKFSKRRNPMRHPSVLFRKSAVLAAGNYRDYYLCEDYDMWVRMLSTGCKCYNINENLVYMRIGEDFFKRRGGVKYMKAILKFKKELLKTGYFSRSDYLKSALPHVVVCLMPNNLRDFVYRKFLRKK